MTETDVLRGYWVTYPMGKEALIRGGPFNDYDTAVKEAARQAEKYTYVGFAVRYGTEEEVKRV